MYLICHTKTISLPVNKFSFAESITEGISLFQNANTVHYTPQHTITTLRLSFQPISSLKRNSSCILCPYTNILQIFL